MRIDPQFFLLSMLFLIVLITTKSLALQGGEEVSSITLYIDSGVEKIERATFETLILIYLSLVVSPSVVALGL